MAYRYGNRNQTTFLPCSIDEYVKEDDPVRVYDAFIEAHDYKELNITLTNHAVGHHHMIQLQC